MPDRLETDIALLNVAGGRPLGAEPPGLAPSPARPTAARGRERDTLFLCLGLRARAAPAAEQFTELLQLAAAAYFGTPGSVTTAARQALLAVNQKLLDGNLREGAPVQGGLLCGSLRGAEFYAVQSGPGALLVAHPTAVERFPNTTSRPLGLSDVLDPQYFHTTVGAGDYLALSQSGSWSEAGLNGLGSLATLSAVAERLRETAGGDFTALVARFEQEGDAGAQAAAPASILTDVAGRWRRPTTTPAPEAEPPSGPEAEGAAPTAVEPAASPSATNWQDLLRRTERWQAAPSPAQPAAAPPPVAAPEPAAEEPRPFERPAAPRPSADLSGAWERVRSGLRSFGRAVGVTLTEAARGFRKLLARALPEGTGFQKDELFVVPTSLQIGIAVGMPLLVVAVAWLIYVQRGQAEQYAEALKQAQVEVTKGRLAVEPLAARPNWEAALTWMARAEKLKPGDPTIAQLRQEAQSKLDDLNGTTRVNYIPLIPNGLGANAHLAQLTLAGRDVYALDTNQKRVWRLAPNPSGVYVVDDSFQCASGKIGPLTIGPLVDIGFVPGPNVRDGDSVVALDSAGGLMYCAPGDSPLGSYLPAPDTGWIQPIAMQVYSDRLYVLDVGKNQIWQFAASGGVFNQPPTGYFSSAVYDLSDVVGFTIAGGDLFLLRRDGRVATCSRSAGGNATCVEAAQFSDARPGRTPGDRLADVTAPTRLIYDQPPEPALFMLNPDDNGLYQLSLKLIFVRQFQPALPLSAPITAVAIDPAKRFFVATPDNVYVAARP